jgi:hypothetical protein
LIIVAFDSVALSTNPDFREDAKLVCAPRLEKDYHCGRQQRQDAGAEREIETEKGKPENAPKG